MTSLHRLWTALHALVAGGERTRGRWLLLLLVASGLACATPRGLEQLEHRRWTTSDDGPSQVGALAQSRDGYLWMGTNDSLYRFDGFRFVRYRTPDGSRLGIVSALLAGGDGLWVGLRAGGVQFIGSQGTTHYAPATDLPSGVVYGFAQGQDGVLWAAANDGLARFDGRRWETVGADWHFPDNARAVLVDREGRVWAASENGLYYLPVGAHAFVDSGLAPGWVSQMTQAGDGSIWVAERYGGALHRLTLEDGRPASQNAPMSLAANGLLFDDQGGLWISTLGNGLLHAAEPDQLFDPVRSGAALERFTSRDGLSSDYLWPLLQDRDGNLWVGSSAGLDRFRRRNVQPAPLPREALNFALAPGADGSLWAGSSNRPALRLAQGRLSQLDLPPPVTSAMSDAQGNVWMGGPNGIWRSRGERLEKVAALPTRQASDSSVRAMVRDDAGDLWVSLNRLGLFRRHDGAWQEQPPPTMLASQKMPVSAARGADGSLWFGYRDNLIVTRHSAEERQWGEKDGLQIGHVTALQLQSQRPWVAGERGLAWFDGARFHSLHLPDGELFGNIYAVLAVPTAAGEDLWLHARGGIFRLAAEDIEKVIADPGAHLRYRAYDLLGGLANDPYQVLPLPTAVRSGDGRLWFSTSNGVVWIDPAQQDAEDAPPRVLIESLDVDGVRLSGDRALQLPAQSARVMIDYTALSLSMPEGLHFRYRLDGYDRDWHYAGSQRQAIYTGLRAGDYRFRVDAVNADGVPAEQEAQLSFSIAPVFYQRPLFLILLGAALIGLFWAFYRSRLRRAAETLRARLEERHAERERIARELHDTLLQGVQGLMLHFQAAAESLAEDQPVRQRMERALDRADQVLAEGRDRVRNLRRRSLAVADLATAFEALDEELEHDPAIVFAVKARGRPHDLRPLVRDEAYRIGREAIANAFCHAGATHVSVVIHYSPRRFALSIADDGRGIAAEYRGPGGRPDHWGLRGMHERAQKIGAQLDIRSAEAQGSEVHLSLPATPAYRRTPRRWRRWLHYLIHPRS